MKKVNLLVRNLEPQAVERLKARAERNGRSLQAELKMILEEVAAESTPEEILARADEIYQQLLGEPHTDSGEIQAQDRLR